MKKEEFDDLLKGLLAVPSQSKKDHPLKGFEDYEPDDLPDTPGIVFHIYKCGVTSKIEDPNAYIEDDTYIVAVESIKDFTLKYRGHQGVKALITSSIDEAQERIKAIRAHYKK